MRPRKNYDLSDSIAAVIAGSIGLGVMVAPMVPDRFSGWVGAVILLPVILVAGWCGWAVLTTLFRGLR